MNRKHAPDPNPWAGTTRIVGLFGLALGGMLAFVLAVSWMNMPRTEPVAIEDMALSPPGVLLPDEVPPALEGHYASARSHYAIFQEVPCFCGCEEMLGHRHLGDCFIRADGSGLEAHALGCGVCLGEAEQVSELIEEGITDPDGIRSAVVAEWGDPYSTSG